MFVSAHSCNRFSVFIHSEQCRMQKSDAAQLGENSGKSAEVTDAARVRCVYSRCASVISVVHRSLYVLDSIS